MPAVSVIIPNYNHAPYLRQRIDSVLAQSYRDFELIILDDCSTDESRTIIEAYRDNEMVKAIIYNDINSGGPFQQWKKGIDTARGKYIWIAESDDWCEPSLLVTLVNALNNDEECVMAYVQTHTVHNNDIIQTSTHSKLSEYIDGKHFIKNYLTGRCAIWNASMLVFKKSGYHKVSELFTTFKMCGDWQFYIELASQGRVFVSGRILNYFRKHDKEVSGRMYSTGANYMEEVNILKWQLDSELITSREFEQHLLNKYITFYVSRHRFSTEMNGAVESKFYSIDYPKVKSMLIQGRRRVLFTARVKRRLGRLFDN